MRTKHCKSELLNWLPICLCCHVLLWSFVNFDTTISEVSSIYIEILTTILFLHNQSFVLWLGILRRKKFPLKNFGKGISPIYWSEFNSFLKSTIQSFWTPNMFLNALSNFCASDIFDMDFTSWCLNALSLISDTCNSEHQSISGYKCLFAVDGFSRVKLHPRIPPLSLVW